MKSLTPCGAAALLVLAMTAWSLSAAAAEDARTAYARELLKKNSQAAALRINDDLGHAEAFRIVRENGATVVEGGSAAGMLYGVQAVLQGDFQEGRIEKPDFDVRGTTLCVMGWPDYLATFNREKYPWFFDRAEMGRFLDAVSAARMNTIFLWSSHLFPYILDMPEYPQAQELSREELSRNREQFRWFTRECRRRNIRVLLHFYNIHISPGLAAAHNISTRPEKPTPLLKKYTHYALERFFTEYDSVGLYICPGESLQSQYQLEWFRDVLFDAAKKSGKNPLLVIRDWTLNMEFRSQLKSLYGNLYSELKHNDESLTSPAPDLRHEQWRGLTCGHIVNLHGPPMDLQPMRWGSPLLVEETVQAWKSLGFIKGAEIYGLSFWQWPYTLDKLEPEQQSYKPMGRKLLSIDRDSIYYDAFGRYLWRSRRDPQKEQEFWENHLSRKFASQEAGRQLYRWYVLTGPISPGIQNLTAVRFGNFWPTVMLEMQEIDDIIKARRHIDDTPLTLSRETGRTNQLYYSRPVDEYFFERYKKRYNMPRLSRKISMPVSQYAKELCAGREVNDAMTPDKVCDLLCELAEESLQTAQAVRSVATEPAAREELKRFVTDSQMYVLATEVFRHKVTAALLKARMLNDENRDLAEPFRRHMEATVADYERLAALTDQTYIFGNDLVPAHWKNVLPSSIKKDYRAQMQWLREPPSALAAKKISLIVDVDAGRRVQFGAERLAERLEQAGFAPAVVHDVSANQSGRQIVVGNVQKSATIGKLAESGRLELKDKRLGKEGFALIGRGDKTIVVAGGDDSGTLYGCLELADRVRAAGRLPADLNVVDTPVFVLRGPCIGMQKTERLYDDASYDFPYTEELFPFFYDKEHWTRYLDFLVENRMNTIYFWNGHPFTSLLELPKYPEAREVSPKQLARNIEMFRWLTREADRRGIWVIQFFYNVHISHSLAKAHNVPFHQSRPDELSKAYMRYCISEFVRCYPNVGLMPCLGEALANRYDKDWMCDVIIAGVKDGMKQLGLSEEPPIICRAHSTPIEEVMRAARKIYGNIYTMHKWTGESLSWDNVRGEDRRLHESLAKLGEGNVINVHLLANLEPFRWGSPEYVQTCMKNARKMGAIGLHLYPLRYWAWPDTADNVDPPLAQIDRDWIWFAAWARYAWNPDRDRPLEKEYWTGRLMEMYGNRQAAEKILEAYEAAGPCQPMILGRLGITGGGRQCLALGMLMTQLINPQRYGPWTLLYTADAPEGERLEEWVEREWAGQQHHGETPPQVADAAEKLSAKAVAAMDAARKHVSRNREEFDRLANDMQCIRALSRCYAAKARAAMLVLRYKHSRDAADLQKAVPFLDEGLRQYRRLVQLTDASYREACALHWPSRKIPFQWSKQRPYKHWRECLGDYERETAHFKRNLALLKAAKQESPANVKHEPLPPVRVKLLSPGSELFAVEPGAKLFTDRNSTIKDVAAELRGLQGIRISDQQAKRSGVCVKFELPEPATILVGFPRGNKRDYAKPPEWEWDVVFTSALSAGDFPQVDVCAHQFPAGRNEVDFGRGSFVIMGFTKASQTITPRLVFGPANLDWLFE